MDNTPEIAVIVNSYNRLNLLKGSLMALANWLPSSQFSGSVIIVFDAGSSDGSREWVRKDAKNLPLETVLIEPEAHKDTSFAAGLNTAASEALKRFPGLKYLLLYETDNQILAETPIQMAVRVLTMRPDVGACGFTVRKHNGTPAGIGQPFPSLLNFFLGKNIVSLLDLEAINYKWECVGHGIDFSPVQVVYTSPLLVRVDAWKASGGLDASWFPFSDCDVDWARRLANCGWKMGVIRTDEVIHDNLDSFSPWSKARVLHNHRGRLRYFKKHHPRKVRIIWPTLLFIRHLAELAAASLFIKDRVRRHHLQGQFSMLLKTCVNSYE